MLRKHWRTILLAVLATVGLVFGGDKLVAQLVPVATKVVQAIPCTSGEVSERCPAPQFVTTTAASH